MNLPARSVWLVAFLGLGCSAERDATTRRLDELQAEISRLKASQMAVQDRLEAVEARPAAAPLVTDALVDDDRPDLAVVKITPPTNAPAPPATPVTPPSDAPRPAIVGDRTGVEVDRPGGRK